MGRPTVLQSASLLTYPPPRGSPHFDRMMERRTEEKYACIQASLVAQMVKNPCNVGDLGSVPGLGRSPGWHGTATHSSILAWSIPMDRGAWRAIVHGIAKCWMQLSNLAEDSTITLHYYYWGWEWGVGVGWRVGGGGAESTDLKKLIQNEARRNEATCYLQPNLNLRTWTGDLNWSVLGQQANPSYILRQQWSMDWGPSQRAQLSAGESAWKHRK